jgi:hypothetical protein
MGQHGVFLRGLLGLAAWIALSLPGLATARGPASEPAASPSSPFTVVRLGRGPILYPGMPGLSGEVGANINGPSLLRVPDWVTPRLGRYYLYFAHHHGQFIRLASADRLEGPWTVRPGVLDLGATAARLHIASPDVQVDSARREIRLYFHGPTDPTARRQATFLATSRDGLHFSAARQELGPAYFRVFAHEGQFYALAKQGDETGLLLRSKDGASPFIPGPAILPRMRHAALLRDGNTLWIVFSRIGDAPESLLIAPMNLAGDWRSWRPGKPSLLLAPERSYEGAGRPVKPSRPGGAWEPLRQLRDPAIHVEGRRIYLLYAVAGERGIALAELRRKRG